MVARLRQVLLFASALAIGYVLGDGPVADWLSDIFDMLRMVWATGRVSRGSSGPLAFLVAGYLLGQGLFLFLRRLVQLVGPWRVRRHELVAAWDPGTRLANRFGLFQYLERCGAWATEDLTTRTQSLALFKLCGLDTLNEERGTEIGTVLLQRVAAELRAASLSEDTTALGRWLSHHFPKQGALADGGVPVTRFPARWSGATFALAFRELEAVRVVSIVRDVSNWIRSELRAIEGATNLSLSATVVLGGAGAPWRTLTNCASISIAKSHGDTTTVVLDANDVRGTSIAQLAGVQLDTESLRLSAEYDDSRAANPAARRDALQAWFRTWGPSIGCLLAAFGVLMLTGGKAPPTTSFPWPESLTQVQVVDPSGTKSVRIVRSRLGSVESPRWRVSNVLALQGDTNDGPYSLCQVYVTVTNLTQHSYYVSTLDFAAIDADGRQWQVEPTRIVRMQNGLTGKWIGPGEAVSGWLNLSRGNTPITGLVFEPDRFTRLTAASKPE